VGVQLLIFDVDGVLTDGRIVPAEGGDTQKFFSSQDGYAIKFWRTQNRKVALISGRKSKLVERRAEELGIDYVQTGIEDKGLAFTSQLRSAGVSADQAAYVGDDFPDLAVMKRCGVPIAVANAIPEIKRAAAYVTQRPGGMGAAAEIVEWILRLEGKWSAVRATL